MLSDFQWPFCCRKGELLKWGLGPVNLEGIVVVLLGDSVRTSIWQHIHMYPDEGTGQDSVPIISLAMFMNRGAILREASFEF